MTTETLIALPPAHVPPLAKDSGVVVCLATGPSLTPEDCDYVRGKAVVVAVNDAHRLAPWADVLFSSDRRWWPFYGAVPSFKGLRYGIGSSVGKKNPFPNGLPVRVLKNAGYNGLATETDALCNGRNSGYAAVNLAVHLGAKRIVLLGYNMGTPGNRSHFFGDHPVGLNQTGGLYPGFRRSFDTMVEPLKDIGVDVINCTEHSSLTSFPCQPLREVL